MAPRHTLPFRRSQSWKSPLLRLPGELRNHIYEDVAVESCLVDNPISGAAPFRGLNLAEETRKTATPHPLTQVCRQMREEFSSVLRNFKSPQRWMRCVSIKNYEFLWFLKHLKSLPPANTINHFLICIDLKTPGVAKYNELMEWITKCRPLSPRNDPVFLIEGRRCVIRFQFSLADVHRECIGRIPGRPLALRCAQGLGLVAHWFKQRENAGAGISHFRPMLVHLNLATRVWELNHSEAAKVARIKYRRLDRPKRYAEPVDRQSKKRMLEDEYWEIPEGFDMYGDKIEHYEHMLESLKGMSVKV